MKKYDNLITILISIYVLFLAIVPNNKMEWVLNILILLIAILYIFEIITQADVKKDFFINFKRVFTEFFTIAFTLFMVLMIVTSLLSSNKIGSLKETSRFFVYYLMYFLIRFRINNKNTHEIMIKFYYASVAIVCVIGIVKFCWNGNLLQTLQYALNNSNALNTSRVSSTLQFPNTFATYLILAVFPTIIQASNCRGKKRIVFVGLILLIVVNLALTFSRNGILAFAIGVLIISMIYNWKFVFLYAVPLIYISVSPLLLFRVKQIINVGSNVGRLNLWKVSEKMINEHFFWGVGSGNFIKLYPAYIKRYPQLSWDLQPLPPHNSYIRAFVEMGVFTAVIFLAMCFDMLKAVYYMKDKNEGIIKNFYNGFLISATCFLMMNCFDDLFYVPKVTMTFLIFVFIAYALKGKESSENS